MKRYLSLIPLLILYIGIVLVWSDALLEGDEIRHMKYAQNLLEGAYTDPSDPELVNGPGYPIVLAGMKMLNAPPLLLCLINAFLLFGGVCYFFSSLSIYFSFRVSVFGSYLLGLYPTSLKWLVYLYSEALAVFLVCGFLYYLLRLLGKNAKWGMTAALAAFFLGWLALTKVIFGYVIIALMFFYLGAFIVKRSQKYIRSVFLLAGALLVCLPYLFYTHSLTDEFPYWGSGGGEILYWRSSPFQNEYGDWISTDVVMGKRTDDYYDTSGIIQNHQDYFESLASYTTLQREQILKEKALENIRQHPVKYLQNTATSGLRLFFNYPYSYTQQKSSTYFYIIPNGLLLLGVILILFLFWLRPHIFSFELRFIMLLSFVFIGGLILANGMARHLVPAVPLLLFLVLHASQHVRITLVGQVSQ